MLINNKNIGYAKEANVLGAIVGVNLLDNTVTLMDEDEAVHVVPMEDVIELEELGAISGTYIYDGDVLKVNTTGKLYEVTAQEDGTLTMHLLDKKFDRTENGQGTSFPRNQLESFGGVVELLGSVHELKANVQTIDFNLAVFRKFVGGEVSYYYAGNNKDKEEIDLIKVLFVGHQILEEEEYERTTFSYEQFQEMTGSGLLKEVNPMEVANYVAGLLHGTTPAKEASDVGEVKPTFETKHYMDTLFSDGDEEKSTDEDEEEEEKCEECDYTLEDCDCDLW